MANQLELNGEENRKFMHLSKYDVAFFAVLSAFILTGGLIDSVGNFLLNIAVWGAMTFMLLMVIGAVVWLYTPTKQD